MWKNGHPSAKSEPSYINYKRRESDNCIMRVSPQGYILCKLLQAGDAGLPPFRRVDSQSHNAKSIPLTAKEPRSTFTGTDRHLLYLKMLINGVDFPHLTPGIAAHPILRMTLFMAVIWRIIRKDITTEACCLSSSRHNGPNLHLVELTPCFSPWSPLAVLVWVTCKVSTRCFQRRRATAYTIRPVGGRHAEMRAGGQSVI